MMKKLIAIPILLCALPAAAAGFSLGIGGGLGASGSLFRVVSPDPTAGNPFGGSYTTADGRILTATEFDTELNESGAFLLRARVPLQHQLSISVGLGFTDLDVMANRRTVANNVDEVPYDQLFIFAADLSVEYDWIATGNRPFVSAGLGSVRLDFEERANGESLDQTKLGVFVGGGFRLRSFSFMDIDFEARVARVAPNLEKEEARLADAESFEAESAIWIWTIGASWVYEF